jgi:uncharacterized protein
MRRLDSSSLRIGVIADTHGLLRPEAAVFLRSADHIAHAGDIGDPAILEELRSIAPLSAVRGNNDSGAWAVDLAETCCVQIGGVACYVIHDRSALHAHPAPEGTQLVITGHSHRPLLESHDGVLFMNPGSAGRRRFNLPIAIGEVLVDAAGIEARITDLISRRVIAELKYVRPRDRSHINW